MCFNCVVHVWFMKVHGISMYLYTCGTWMHMGMVHGNFHVPLHVCCINTHGKGTWKLLCTFTRVVHECAWERCMEICMYLNMSGAWMTWEWYMEICMYLNMCGAWMYMGLVHGNWHVPQHVWCMNVHGNGRWKFACTSTCVVHECTWERYMDHTNHRRRESLCTTNYVWRIDSENIYFLPDRQTPAFPLVGISRRQITVLMICWGQKSVLTSVVL